ncbi:MAG: hypothetical protein ACJ75J_17080 [Cytophagaceae bacterium]|jgi:hypothetical protein
MKSDEQKLIEEIGEGVLQVAHASMNKNINRYTMNPGKIYGDNSGSKRYKILKVQVDTIFYKDLVNQKVYSGEVGDLLPAWSQQGIHEIAFIDDIIDMIKTHLGPLLGPFIMGGLTSWLLTKLK